MGKVSKISWTHATFNGWIGCQEVSPACDRCYARTLAERYGWAKWGKNTPRHRTSASYWKQPLKWNAEAEKTGTPRRVFAFSLADWAEDRRDLDPWRADLFQLVEATPWLIWMLLTKRADYMKQLLPATWIVNPRPNVWLGVTAENQRRADERIPALMRVPAIVHWVSAEPLLGSVDFRPWLRRPCDCMVPALDGAGQHSVACSVFKGDDVGVDWIICGGESGSGARRMDPAWSRDILAQCRTAGVAFHFKQKGEVLARELGCKDKAGKDPEEWPRDLRVQEFPVSV